MSGVEIHQETWYLSQIVYLGSTTCTFATIKKRKELLLFHYWDLSRVAIDAQ